MRNAARPEEKKWNKKKKTCGAAEEAEGRRSAREERQQEEKEEKEEKEEAEEAEEESSVHVQPSASFKTDHTRTFQSETVHV